jgi:hypothetical protein
MGAMACSSSGVGGLDMPVQDVRAQSRVSKVEIGQLVFIAAASLVILGLRRLHTHLPFDMPAVARLAPAYAIGGLSAYGRVARLAGLF